VDAEVQIHTTQIQSVRNKNEQLEMKVNFLETRVQFLEAMIETTFDKERQFINENTSGRGKF